METKLKRPGLIKSTVLGWLGLTDVAGWQGFYGTKTNSGQLVTVNSALQLSAAWACVRLISETISTLPLQVYKTVGDKKLIAKDHNLYSLLHNQPNADMTAVVFWQSFFSSMLLWGNAYVEIHRLGNKITSLEFLLPELVSSSRLSNGAIEWSYSDPVTKVRRIIRENQMWHTPAFTVDGISGLSPIRMGSNVFGNAQAADKASSETFKNGLSVSGLVTMDIPNLDSDKRNKIRDHVKSAADKGGLLVFEKGVGFEQIQMNPQDAELLSTRHFNVEEICRWFRVPPFMVGHSEKSTSWGSGIEQQMIAFNAFVLRPWCVRVEQSIAKSLIEPKERMIISSEFSLEGLLRGDSSARAAFYSTMTQNGIMTRDECRAKENLDPHGGQASLLTVQSNLLPIDMLGKSIGKVEKNES